MSRGGLERKQQLKRGNAIAVAVGFEHDAA
jgi:hypothetical protein